MEMLTNIIKKLDLAALLGESLAAYSVAIAVVAIVVLALFARYGFTVLKKVVCLVGAAGCAYAGAQILVPKFLAGVALPIVSTNAVVGIVLAIVGGFIFCRFFKFGLFLIGAAAGYLVVADIVIGMVALEGIIATVASVVIAIVVGLLLRALFKPLFVIISSLVGMIGAGALLCVTLIPVDSSMVTIAFIAFAVIGLIAGIVCAKKQFADNK